MRVENSPLTEIISENVQPGNTTESTEGYATNTVHLITLTYPDSFLDLIKPDVYALLFEDQNTSPDLEIIE